MPEAADFIGNRRGFHSIPIIDVQKLRDPGSTLDERRRVGSELDRACREVGFFYVRNHGVCDDLTTRIRESSRRWFDLPADVKAEIALTADCKRRGFRGYQALGSNVTRYDGGFQRDWHEAIDLYKHFDESHPDAKAGLPLHGPNPWPTQIEGYQEALETYVQECISLGADLLRGIALGLQLDEDFFGGSNAGDPFWVMRIIHYPPLEQAAASSGSESTLAAFQGEEVERSVQLSCGEHTDYGLLTIVNQDENVSALQVKNSAGKWVAADPIPGTFVCNIGDMFKVWTNGLYQPTMHRVINLSSAKRRISVPFFYEPNFNTRVEPLPQLCGPESPPLYAGITYGNHLQSKVFQNFEI